MPSHADCSVNYIVIKIRSVSADFLFFDILSTITAVESEWKKKKWKIYIYIYIHLFFLLLSNRLPLYSVTYIYITGLYSNYSINRIMAKPQPVFRSQLSLHFIWLLHETTRYPIVMVYARARCRILYTRTDNRIYIIYF